MIVKVVNLFLVDLSIDLCKKYWKSRKSRVQPIKSQLYILTIANSFRNQTDDNETKKKDRNNLHFQSNHFKPEFNSKISRGSGLPINNHNCYPTSK